MITYKHNPETKDKTKGRNKEDKTFAQKSSSFLYILLAQHPSTPLDVLAPSFSLLSVSALFNLWASMLDGVDAGKCGGGEGVFMSCMAIGVMTIDPRIPKMPAKCRDRVRRVFTDQADIACTKREAP